jgi:TetR/AcrR family transcriptional regulator
LFVLDSEPNTQQIILDAALREFHQNGFKGARTSRIAEAAGISRTMLHYYFNTKEALFEAVLNKTFGAVMPHLQRMATEEQDVFKIIENLVDAVADMLEENPGLPSFVVNILNENPQLILNLTAFQNENTPGLLDSILASARAEKRIGPAVGGEDLLLHIWGLCSTPYLLAPYISAKEKRDEAGMRAFVRRRREVVKSLIFNGIKT